jgi:hypothetical protein
MSCGNCGCSDCGGCGGVMPCPHPNMVRVDNEPLSSVMDNFVASFFGTVTKTVVNGQVVWTLPCNLDTGLPSNPRQTGEGLACYFLRLFLTGIIGLVGPQGPAGPAGADGAPAWSYTVGSFLHPVVGGFANIQLTGTDWCIPGAWVLISGSGYYQITMVSSPNVQFQLISELPGHLVSIPAGSLVVGTGPAGPPGATGATGPTGTTDLNTISPTSLKGDILVDNGVLTPLASLVAMHVGANGTRLMADSTQINGMSYQRVDLSSSAQVMNSPWPISSTDNAIARYDGTNGHIQDSTTLVTDSGDVQTIGGNARGTNAVDLQSQRTGPTQVASGVNSAIGGGVQNTASGQFSTVPGGVACQATGRSSFAVGESALALGDYSVATGKNAYTAGYGVRVHSAGSFITSGKALSLYDLIWRNVTADATPTELFLDQVSQRSIPGTDSAQVGDILILGTEIIGGDTAAWHFYVAYRNKANTISIVGTPPTGTLIGASAGCAGSWGTLGSVAVTADIANYSLKVTVTGEAGKNIRWSATLRALAQEFA